MAALGVLEVKGLTKRFGGLTAVGNVSFDVNEGEIVSIIGPNGAGKTTLFNLITGFLPPTSGSAYFQGIKTGDVAAHRLADQGLVRSFQKTTVFPELTVLEGLQCGMHARTKTGVWDALLRTGRCRAEERSTRDKALAILAFIGLSHRADVLCKNLSYGEQKLWALGAALAAEPRLLLLDEPAAGLNPTETAEMMHLLLCLKAQGMTILLVEHNMALVMEVSDRIVAVNFGEKIAEGRPEQIQVHPAVIAAYLGEGSFTGLG